jgi:N-acetyl-beta-hexosaminidase
MVRGIGKTKVKKKPWKTRVERDIKCSKDIKEAGLEGLKALQKGLISLLSLYLHKTGSLMCC